MSGIESCAIVAPSTNSTMPCTTDCGCTTTSIASKSTPNSSWASMTSRPLFMSVDESIVILAPMFQVGCASASAGCTRRELGRRAAAERAAARGEHDARDLAHASRPAAPARSPSARSRPARSRRRPRRAPWRRPGPPRSGSPCSRARAACRPRARRGSRAAPRSRRPRSARRRHPDGRRARRATSGSSGPAQARSGDTSNSARCRSSRSVLRPAASATTRKSVAVPAQHVERLGPDRTGRAQDDDAGGHRFQVTGSSGADGTRPEVRPSFHKMLRWSAR